MTRKLYDLAFADRSRRFSPFCWRAKLALKHKKLDFETIDVAFTEKSKLEFSGQKLVPVLVDGDNVVTDSWAIACYLDDTYKDAPALMDGAHGRAHAMTIKHWVETSVNGLMLKIVILDLFERLSQEDKDYFRESREARFGMTLEEFHKGEAGIGDLQKALTPARITLQHRPFLGGEGPSFADILVMATLLWGRASSDIAFIADDDEPVRQWLDRMQERYAPGETI